MTDPPPQRHTNASYPNHFSPISRIVATTAARRCVPILYNISEAANDYRPPGFSPSHPQHEQEPGLNLPGCADAGRWNRRHIGHLQRVLFGPAAAAALSGGVA